jgi:hypothetical protein
VFQTWLNNHLIKYIVEESEPDLWDEFRKGNKTLNINSINFEDQSNFLNDEKKQVQLAIADLKLLIQKEFETSENEQRIVDSRLDYLVEATKRLNKFDWKSLAISTLISLSMALSLDTEKGRQLFELFKKVFGVIPQLLFEQ